MEDILEKLKQLKGIKASSECAQRTELLFRHNPQAKRDFSGLLGITLAFVVLLFSFFLLNINKTSEIARKPKPKTAISQIDFNLKLPQLSYYQEIENIISLALGEIIKK